MKFSIITINYNNCKGLKRTLDSVVSQTSKDFEWIVIDGGSTDGSKELIEKYQEATTYWCSEPDKGIYNAMNKGVAKASGDYCLFLNSGDHLCDIRVMERLMKTTFSADIVACDIYIDGKSPLRITRAIDSVNAFWIYENTFYHQATWIRREVLIKCPYRENFERISDWTFFFEAIVILNCSYQHVPMVISVFYTDGISSTPFPVGNTDRTQFLSNFFPVKFITDVRLDPIHPISVGTYHMTKLGKKLMDFMFKLIAYVDYRLFLPIGKIWLYINKK